MRDLETLNAIEDIRRLEARYARYADDKRWEDLAGLFTEDGSFRWLDVDVDTLARAHPDHQGTCWHHISRLREPPGVTTENVVQNFLDTPAEKPWYNPTYLKAHERGGHFTPRETPRQ